MADNVVEGYNLFTSPVGKDVVVIDSGVDGEFVEVVMVNVLFAVLESASVTCTMNV